MSKVKLEDDKVSSRNTLGTLVLLYAAFCVDILAAV